MRRGRPQIGLAYSKCLGFNPLPRRATRETERRAACSRSPKVSIHSCVVRRGRHCARRVGWSKSLSFQSTPASCDAGDSMLMRPTSMISAFQSTPASCDAGDTEGKRFSRRSCCFNPLPRRATRETHTDISASGRLVVSIHSRVVRRGRPAGSSSRTRRHGCFNPLPRRATRETGRVKSSTASAMVSIHSRVVRRGRLALCKDCHQGSLFQSTPASCDAGDMSASASVVLATMFQSTPASCDAGDKIAQRIER